MHYVLLAKIQNAQAARKRTMRVPYSSMDFDVAKILVERKFLGDVRKKTYEKKNFLELDLASGGESRGGIQGFKILSKPSRRVYISYRALKPVRQGYGVGVISTTGGIMTTTEAKRSKVGGEYLFQVW
mgnify:CR=1 FL=1